MSDGSNSSDGSGDRDDSIILKPGPHDVLCGRGGGTNNHSGNVRFRQLVNEYKLRYLAASKVDKPKVARDVVTVWRGLEPPGRFLARRDDSKKGPGSVKAEGNVWYDVGDKKAREKASQCLRERTPDVLPFVKEMQRQQNLFTGEGLRMVEQQMQLMQDTSGGPDPSEMVNGAAAANGGFVPPAPVHSMNEPEVQNAFSAEYFFTHGFNNAAGGKSQGNSDDPLSMQQMSKGDQQWGNLQSEFATNAAKQEELRKQIQQLQDMQNQLQNSMEPVPLPSGFPKAAAAAAAAPEKVSSSAMASSRAAPAMASLGAAAGATPDQATFGDDELTWEEYTESMRPYEGLQLAAQEQEEQKRKDSRRTKALQDMQENSWVRSFHSIEKSLASEGDEHESPGVSPAGVSKAAATLTPPRKRNNLEATLARQQKLAAGQAMSTRTMQTAASAVSTGAFSTMSGVSMFSEMSEDSRVTRMSQARGLTSNLSLMSEMTELSDTLQSLDLSRSTNPAS